jgi:hypothetical protein
MKGRKILLILALLTLSIFAVGIDVSYAKGNPNKPLFTDEFKPSDLWGNESGEWLVGYFAKNPSHNPLAYTSLPYDLTNFEIEVDIKNIKDGGIFLRSSYQDGYISGVFLVTGGHGGTGTGLYWQVAHNCKDFSAVGPNVTAPTNEVTGLFTPGESDARIRIVVQGNIYSAYVDDDPVPKTTLINNDFTSGKVALFNFNQIFTRVVIKKLP